MRKICTLLAVSIIAHVSLSFGSGVVRGTVYDNGSMLPVDGVTVTQPDTTRSAVTGSDGTFELSIGNTNVLTYKKSGYRTKTAAVAGDKSKVTVKLERDYSRGKVFHVAVTGNDRNPGTADEPFATLHHARDAVRASGSGCTVIVHEGTYYFGAGPGKLVFGPEDSGQEGAENVYMAAPGETVTLSGGVKIHGTWKPYRDGIYKTKVPANLVGGDELFVNGKLQHPARFPNYDPKDRFRKDDKHGYKKGVIQGTGDRKSNIDMDKMTLTDLSTKKWDSAKLQAGGAYLDAFMGGYWGNMQWYILGKKGNVVTVGKGGFQLTSAYQNYRGVNEKSQYFVARVFEELDTENEWYLDKTDNTLYYYPPSDVDINTALVEISSIPNAVEFRGTRANPVHHIKLQGFRFSHTETTFLEDYKMGGENIFYSVGDWTIWRGGTVFIEGAENIAVQKCFFDCVGGNGVFINKYAKNIAVCNNDFSGAGESCVALVGQTHMKILTKVDNPARFVKGDIKWTWGKQRSYNVPSNCVIYNNRMHDFGRHGKQVAGVYMALTQDNTISHNEIYNAPRAGICINDGYWGGHTIEWNNVHDCVYETGDHGPFNSWGRDEWWDRKHKMGPNDDVVFSTNPYFKKVKVTTVRYNRFAAGGAPSGYGMDLDDASSMYDFYSNLGVNIGCKMREGSFNTFENNIFYLSETQINIHSPSPENHLRIVRNIEVYDDDDIHIKGTRWGLGFPATPKRWLEECDYNTWWGGKEFKASISTGKDKQSAHIFDLSQWRKLGFGAHSAFEDPGFVDPEHGDFTVTNRHVLERGFKNFRMDNFGLIK